MSEPSPEAVVAGEAAANAVEQLHATEAVINAAEEAQVTAVDAVVTASEAEEASELAAETAAAALAEAAQAQHEAETATETAVAVGTSLEERFTAYQEEMRQNWNQLREFLNAQSQPDTTVQKVEVTHASPENTGETGQPGSGGSHSESTSGTGRSNGLRRRRR